MDDSLLVLAEGTSTAWRERLAALAPGAAAGEPVSLPADPAAAYTRLLSLTGNGRPGIILALPAETAGAATLTALMGVLGRFRDRLVAVTADGTIREIPFPRCRYLLRERLNAPPGRWEELVDLANLRLAREIPAPELYLRPDAHAVWLGRREAALAPPAFLLYWLLAMRCRNGLPCLRGRATLADELQAFAASTNRQVMPELPPLEEIAESVLGRLLDEIATAVAAALPRDDGRECCLPAQGLDTYGLALPADKVICPRNY